MHAFGVVAVGMRLVMRQEPHCSFNLGCRFMGVLKELVVGDEPTVWKEISLSNGVS